MSAEEMDRARRELLERHAASGDPRVACRARMALALLKPFQDAVNTEIENASANGLDDGMVLADAGDMVSHFAVFLADHLVVRGLSFAQANQQVGQWVGSGVARLHAHREARGEGPEFRTPTSFDFRNMMRGEGNPSPDHSP